jgi:hypothetical protein
LQAASSRVQRNLLFEELGTECGIHVDPESTACLCEVVYIDRTEIAMLMSVGTSATIPVQVNLEATAQFCEMLGIDQTAGKVTWHVPSSSADSSN